jgi:hypothetical protein
LRLVHPVGSLNAHAPRVAADVEWNHTCFGYAVKQKGDGEYFNSVVLKIAN